MNRTAALVGIALIALGGIAFLWKAILLDLPVLPREPASLWRVELEVDARGSGQRGSVRAALPATGLGQIVFDERTAGAGLQFSVRPEGDQRVGVWKGRFEGVHHLAHGLRVELSPVRVDLAARVKSLPPPDVGLRYGGSTPGIPSAASEIRGLLALVADVPEDDHTARLLTLFNFVTDEVATARSGSDDALLTLAAREGNPEGKARLLTALLRAAGIPARIVAGLRLRPGHDPLEAVWVEAWIGGEWASLSPEGEFAGTRPANRLVLRTDEASLLRATGLDAIGHRYHAIRELLRPEEVAAFMVPSSPLLARTSLYRLPISTQETLRLILLIPLATLLVAGIRNLVGLPSFGTFMPVLIALAMRATGLPAGLALVGSVLLLGIVGRLVLERLRLLLVPRLCILLCLVVLAITLLALLGGEIESRALFGGLLFPIVILTMLIERFSIVTAEEGMRQAMVRLAASTVIAIATYPIFASAVAEHLMFSFPELVVCVIGVLVLIGGYTGYRVADLVRFRSLAESTVP